MALPLPKSSASSERVKVIVRTRPLSQKELDEGHVSVVEVFPGNCEIEVRRPPPSSGTDEANLERKVFAFDAVYDERFSQSFLYEDAFRQLVDSVLEGFNGTIFAYGQTGTGKTFTMEGNMYNKRESMCCSSVAVVKPSRSTVDRDSVAQSSAEPDGPNEGSVVTVVSASDCTVTGDRALCEGGSGRRSSDGGDAEVESCGASTPAPETLLLEGDPVASKTSNVDDCDVGVVGDICVVGDSVAVNDDVFTPAGNHESEESEGVIPNAFKHIFKHIASNEQKRYLVRASYLEIYQEEIRDLLCKDGIKKCELKENRTGVYVKDLSSFLCGNFGEINALMAKGNKNRSVGATNMNEHSSRSHAIFMITVEVSEVWPDGRNHFKVGKLNLVDLAGSERQMKTGASGERLKEATKINLSLSALGNVIAALVDGKSTHIPYRDSKLTRLLQDSLGGNSRTIMVATVGPASFNYDETMTTLRYASRAKKIKNKPKINEDPKDAMLREYQEEIARLRSQLLQKKAMYNSMTTEEGSESTENQNPIPKSSKGRSRARTANSSSSSSSEQMKLAVAAETQRFQELAPLLQPYGLDHTTDPKYIMSVLEKRREALLKDTVTVKEEKDRLLQKLEETQQRVKITETECTKLSERIQWLESKVLNGGKSLLDHTNEQQKLIEMKQQELAETRLREQGIRLKLAEHELTANEIKGALAAHQTDVEVKSRKLQKLRFKLHTTREELEKSHKDFNRQRKELTVLQADLRRELKLKRLIIDNFVPMVIRKLVENRIQHKEKYDGYYLVPVETTVMQTVKRPPMNKVLKLPLFHRSDSGTVYAFENVHYQDENILQLQLEMPKHLTTRYIPPRSNPYITSLMKRAFELAEQETVIDVGRHSHRKRNSHSSQSQHKPGGHAHVKLVCIRLWNSTNYSAHFT